MSEKNRFISGVINRCKLDKPGRFDKYSVHIDGAWEDDKELKQGYLNSKYPVRVYEKGADDPSDPAITVGKKFLGRCLVSEKEYDGKTYQFLQAVSIEKMLGDDDEQQSDSAQDGNPFKENPLA